MPGKAWRSERRDAARPAEGNIRRPWSCQHPPLSKTCLSNFLGTGQVDKIAYFSYTAWYCAAGRGVCLANIACFTRQMLQADMSVSEHAPHSGGNSGSGIAMCFAVFHWVAVPHLCRNMHTLFVRALSFASGCLL
jgi:hypothetical protein